MRKTLTIITVLLLVLSCSKKEVLIPIIALDGPTEIHNNSQIWMFHNEKGKKQFKVNEKNRISTTHWLFNIDKRLSIKDVLPEAKRLLIKHKEKSPHNHGGMNNYFSYINSMNKKWSFYQFDSIQYTFLSAHKLPIKRKDTILLKVLNKNIDFDFLKKDSVAVIQNAFINTMSFQAYMDAKAIIDTKIPKGRLSPIEYIYSR